MTTAAPSISNRYAVTNLPIRRFTVAEYHRMIADGYFDEDEPLELLEGLLVAKMPRNPPHGAYLHRAGRVITQRLPGGWHVRLQDAITTGDSVPEPDVVVVAGDELDYELRLPGPPDIALVIEVAHSTLSQDRGVMQRVYARAGISVYWIINLVNRQVEVFTEPSGPVPNPAYAKNDVYRAGQSLPLLVGGTD